MKKFASIILILSISLSLILCAAGCGGSSGGTNFEVEDKNFGNYDEANVVEGMSAFDLVTEAYANFTQDTNFVREEYFTFAAKNGSHFEKYPSHSQDARGQNLLARGNIRHGA